MSNSIKDKKEEGKATCLKQSIPSKKTQQHIHFSQILPSGWLTTWS